jgi:cobalt-zinc-cadmium efflux system outer membrane protein
MKTTAISLIFALTFTAAPVLARQAGHAAPQQREAQDHTHHNHPPAATPAQPPSAPPQDHSQHGGQQMDHSKHTAPQGRQPLTRRPEDRPVEPTGPVLNLADLEATALGNSPLVARAEAAVAAAEGRARQAGLWPNPVAGYEGEEIRTGEPLRGGQHGFFVEQTIVLGGKLGKRRDVFLQEVKQAEAVREATGVMVRNQVRLAYFAALAEQRRVEFLERMRALVEEAIVTSDGLYNVGQADRPDVLQIEIEGRQAELSLLQSRSRLDRARRQLGIVVGEPGVASGQLSGDLEDALPRIEAAVLAEILERSPQVAATRLGVERARANIRSQRAERVPDLYVRGGGQYNRERNEILGGAIGWQATAEVGVDIPIFNRNQGGIAAAEAELRAAEAEARQLELELRGRFETAYTAYVNALRVADVYREEIIPKADEAYRLYLARYQEMTAAYPQVLIARRTWLQVNLDYIDTLEALYRAALPLQGFLLGGDGSTGAMDDALGLPGSERTAVAGSDE